MKKFISSVFALRKLALVVGILIFVGFVGYLGLYYLARSNLQGLYFFDWGRTSNTKSVSFTVGDTTFLVPQNYLYQKDLMQGGNVWGFNIEVLLPDMTPYNDSLKYEFDECQGNCRRLNIFIHRPVMQGDWLGYALSRRLKEVKESGNWMGESAGIGVMSGLIYYVAFGAKIEKNEGYAHFTPDGHADFYYNCLKEGSAPSPGCKGDMEYGHDVTIEYTHHRRYLPQWREINDKVQQLLQSFEQHPNREGEK